MYDILLLNCRLLHRDPQVEPDVVDIAIASGKIVEIAPYISTSAKLELDLQQKVVSPPFVESHIHLDSALTAGQPRWNQSGTLFEGIDIWRDRKQNLDPEDIKTRAIATLQQQAMQGVLFVRTHVDVSEPNLTALQAMLEVRETVKDWMTLQIVAFPQDGIYGSAENEALLEKALKLGADAVGGIPHYEFTKEDGLRSVQRIFELAEQYDRLIDIHCDEIDDDQSRFLEVVAAHALRSGMGAKVTASHTTAFGSYNNAYAQKLLGLVARSQINCVANPLINITLQGRTDSYPKRRGLTRVKELWQAGINVSLGHDCIQDCWYPLGTGNMLDVASMLVHVSQMTGIAEIDACYNMVTWHGAKTLNVQDSYGIEVGKPANLIAIAGIDRFDALRRRATVSYVIAQGQLIAKTESPKSQWQPTLDGLQVEVSRPDDSDTKADSQDPIENIDTDEIDEVNEIDEIDEIVESQSAVSTLADSQGIKNEDEPLVDEEIAIAVPDEPDSDEDIIAEPAIAAESDDSDLDSALESDLDSEPKFDRDEDNSLFTIVELPAKGYIQDDPVEEALERLDRMSLNGTKPLQSSDSDSISSYSLDDLLDELPDADDPVEKALTQLDRMALNGSTPVSSSSVHSSDDISAYSLDDLSDEIPDAEAAGQVAVEEPVKKSIMPEPELAEDEVANDPATIYSIEQLVNELFSKEM